jgi:hypothetical protein
MVEIIKIHGNIGHHHQTYELFRIDYCMFELKLPSVITMVQGFE